MARAEKESTAASGDRDTGCHETTQLLPGHYKGNERKVSTLRAQIVIVLVQVFLSSTGATYLMVLTQYLVHRLTQESGYGNLSSVDHCTSNASDLSTKHANEIQKKVADYLTNFTLVQTIPAFFACFLVGSYSDFIGRRILLLLPIFTQLLLVSIISCVIKFNLDVNLLHASFALDGIVGSWPAIIVLEYAITADINISKDSRTLWMYVVFCSGCAVLSGVTLGTSYLIQTLGFFWASLLVTGMALLNFLIPLLFLQDTLAYKSTYRIWNPIFHCKRLFGIYVSKGSRRRRATRTLSLALFLFAAANDMNLLSIDSLYQLHEPFCWNFLTIGEYASIRFGVGNIAGAIWIAIWRHFLPVEVIAMVGVAFQVLAYTFEAFIKKSWQFYIVPALLVPNSCAVSIARSMLSLLLESDRQGALFASIAVGESLLTLSTGAAYNQVYGATVSTMPGAVYLLMSSCALVALVLFIIYFFIREKPEEQIVNISNHEADVQESLVANT